MCKRALRCLIGLSAVLALAPPLAARQRPRTDSDFSPDAERVRKAIQNAGEIDPAFAQRRDARQRELQPLFIVVPGILGSKLEKNGHVLWGELGVPRERDRRELELIDSAPGDPVTPQVMDHVSIRNLFKIDVYGTLNADLRFTSFTGADWYDHFPYDWRDDIRISAKRLHEHLLAQKGVIRNRDVIFIAHSMGGLVVRWWYNTYYRSRERQTEYEFLRPPRILFLGTPHFGSASALLRLIRGFGADSMFEKLSNYVTSDLNAAASSFYSVYELLPFSNAAVEFHSIEGQPSVTNDLLDVGLWRACRWGGMIRERDGEKFYTEILPARLAVAREFREHLLKQEPIPNVVCFYSDSAKTPRTLIVRQHERGECTVEVDRRAAGDGSVVAEVIPYEPRPAHPHADIRRLQTAHMRLPNAHGFRSYINDLRTRVEVQSIVAADPTDDVIAAFRRARALFPVPLDITALDDRVTRQTLDIDRRILRGGVGGKSDAVIAAELYAMAERAKNLSRTASQLYALALAFDPDGPHAPFAANNLAHNLLEDDMWNAARGYLEHAQKRIGRVPADEKEFLRTLHKNTGVAYEKTADYCRALDAYTRAGSKGDTYRINLTNALTDGELSDCAMSR